MFLIAGWGKSAKNLGFVGIVKCTNCKNYGAMSIYEIAHKVSMFFVPVAKYHKRWYVVCPTCNWGSEVNEALRDQILRESIGLPDEETTGAIWNDLDAAVLETVKSQQQFNAKIFDDIIRPVRDKYPEKYVTYVATYYWESVVDPDKPR